MESWESPLLSWTNTTPINLKSSGLTDMSKAIRDSDTDLPSTEQKSTRESLSREKCNGIMGVPITFMDKYNPEQFEIIGATESEGKGFSGGLWDAESGVAQPLVNGMRKYKRLFIRYRWKESDEL